MKKVLYLLVGSSGSGKTTLGNELKRMGLTELISHTTRSPRKGEKNGVDYHFCSEEEFHATEMIESSVYPSDKGWSNYGISKRELENKLAKGPAFAVVEKNGATKLKSMYPSLVKIVFLAITKKTAINRMVERGETMATIRIRIDKAENDNEFIPHKWTNYTLKNCSLEGSVKIMNKIVYGEDKVDYLRVVGL